MSARYLPRELGVVITCNVDGCTSRHQTAAIIKKHNRADAKRHGWIRGGLPGKKLWDICPTHAPAHTAEVAQWKKDKAARIEARREAKRLRFATKEEQAKAKAERAAARAAKRAAKAQEASASP